jgi:Sulfotransferase family
MILSHAHRFIFIKTLKTAATSVEVELAKLCADGDIVTPISDEDEILRPDARPRNYMLPRKQWPLYARLQDLLGFEPERENIQYFNHMPAHLVRQRIGDDIWRRYFKFTIERNPWDRMVSMWYWAMRERRRPVPFRDWLAKDSRALHSNIPLYSLDGQIAVDTICQYDQIEDELRRALGMVGVTWSGMLPRAKSHVRTPGRNFRSYYDEPSRRIVAQRHAREIELFGYAFDDSDAEVHWHQQRRASMTVALNAATLPLAAVSPLQYLVGL